MAPRQSQRSVSRIFLLDWKGFPTSVERLVHLMFPIAGGRITKGVLIGVEGLLQGLTLEQMEGTFTAPTQGGSVYQYLANFLYQTGW